MGVREGESLREGNQLDGCSESLIEVKTNKQTNKNGSSSDRKGGMEYETHLTGRMIYLWGYLEVKNKLEEKWFQPRWDDVTIKGKNTGRPGR